MVELLISLASIRLGNFFSNPGFFKNTKAHVAKWSTALDLRSSEHPLSWVRIPPCAFFPLSFPNEN